MTALLACLYLLACIVVASRLLGVIAENRQVGRAMKLQIFMTLFLIFFYLNFFILGYVSLITGQGLVTTGYALVLALAVATVVLSAFPAKPSGLLRDARSGAAALASSRLVLGTTAIFAAAGTLSMFGYPKGFEVSAYHLPGALAMLGTGTLQAWDGNFPHTFPANAGIYTAFLLRFLPEKFVSSANLLFLLPLFAGTYTLSRLAGADRNASLLVGCGLLSIPMVAFSSVELSADIGGVALIVLAMSFALTQRIGRRIALVLAGASAGLALGFKSVHLMSIGLIGIVILGSRPEAGHQGARRWQDNIANACMFTVGVAATGSFWLVRNYLAFDNPFYPVNLPLIGDLLGWAKAADVDFASRQATQFEWVRRPAEWLVYPWIEWHVLGQNFKHSSGLGAFFAATVPVSLGIVAASVFSQRIPKSVVRMVLLLAICFIVGIWWLLGDRQPRYAFAAIAYCMPLVAWVVSQADRRWRPALDSGLALCIAVMLSIFFFKELIVFGNKIVLSGHTSRAQYYAYPEEIDQLPAGARILNLAGRPWHYPLAGSGFRNQVISMPEGRRLLGMPPSLGPPESVVLDSAVLKEKRVSHIFATGARITADACMRLTEQAALDKNPDNGVPLKSRRILYVVSYDTAAVCDKVHTKPNG